VINAGSGAMAHPTQGLLDAYTIMKERGQVRGERVLIVGDILHSRVARSNFDVLAKLGAEVAVCGPRDFLPAPEQIPGIRIFTDLDEGLRWATVCMGLRIQLERHGGSEQCPSAAVLEKTEIKERLASYHQSYGITRARLQSLLPGGILMHPGPINHGVEFSSDVLHDPRSRVLEQVTNGVLIRAALLARTLGLEKE
jgi:aspartate carbamoyltransferase catalytic subunit